MLVILTENQILLPQQVCQTCLLANQNGQPRWHQGQLRCARRVISKLSENQPEQYECQMGFQIANVDSLPVQRL